MGCSFADLCTIVSKESERRWDFLLFTVKNLIIVPIFMSILFNTYTRYRPFNSSFRFPIIYG